MRILNRALLVSAFGGSALTMAACPASLDDECAKGACVAANTSSGGEGGTEGGGDGGDPCAKTPTDPKCLDESTSLFVSDSKGDDNNPEANKAKPLKTVGAALTKVTPTRKRIFVCEGNYAEEIVIASAANGVSVIGGLTCDWTVSTNRPALGKGASPLKIVGATGVTIAKVAIKSADTQSGSSIAVFASRSQLALSEVIIAAGKAGNGQPGVSRTHTFPATLDLLGNSGDDGGGQKEYTCPGSVKTTGGAGGASGVDGAKGSPGTKDNKGTVAACTGGTGGTIGDTGASPAAGLGASAHGALTQTAWTAADGVDGADGEPGQGGGGGAGLGTGTGGSGGAGGCGGAGGPGGKGGGASIALASFESTITISASELASDTAGDGGLGAGGQAGQSAGGVGGNGQTATTACKGGSGGPGGNGASGGGGAGGISVGILFSGAEPTRDDATKAGTRPGKAGDGGGPSVGKGKDGVSASSLKAD